MKEVFTVEVEPISKAIPAHVSLKRWVKNAGYYGLRVTRLASRHSNPEPGQQALSPLPKPSSTLDASFPRDFPQNKNKNQKDTK